VDDIGLTTLGRELQKDMEVASAAAGLARERIEEGTASGIEGCAPTSRAFLISSNKWAGAWPSANSLSEGSIRG